MTSYWNDAGASVWDSTSAARGGEVCRILDIYRGTGTPCSQAAFFRHSISLHFSKLQQHICSWHHRRRDCDLSSLHYGMGMQYSDSRE